MNHVAQNRLEQVPIVIRDKGRFAKGCSGNAGGRPRVIQHIQDLARQHTAEAIETLAEIMKDKDSPSAARVGAATALLDRGWGKPRQAIEVSTGRMPGQSDFS